MRFFDFIVIFEAVGLASDYRIRRNKLKCKDVIKVQLIILQQIDRIL